MVGKNEHGTVDGAKAAPDPEKARGGARGPDISNETLLLLKTDTPIDNTRLIKELTSARSDLVKLQSAHKQLVAEKKYIEGRTERDRARLKQHLEVLRGLQTTIDEHTEEIASLKSQVDRDEMKRSALKKRIRELIRELQKERSSRKTSKAEKHEAEKTLSRMKADLKTSQAMIKRRVIRAVEAVFRVEDGSESDSGESRGGQSSDFSIASSCDSVDGSESTANSESESSASFSEQEEKPPPRQTLTKRATKRSASMKTSKRQRLETTAGPMTRSMGDKSTPKQATEALIRAIEVSMPWDTQYDKLPQFSHTFNYKSLKVDARRWLEKLQTFHYEHRHALWERQHWVPIRSNWADMLQESYARKTRQKNARTAWDELHALSSKLVNQRALSNDVWCEPFIWEFSSSPERLPSWCKCVDDLATLDTSEPKRCGFVNNIGAHPFYRSDLVSTHPNKHPLPLFPPK